MSLCCCCGCRDNDERLHQRRLLKSAHDAGIFNHQPSSVISRKASAVTFAAETAANNKVVPQTSKNNDVLLGSLFKLLQLLESNSTARLLTQQQQGQELVNKTEVKQLLANAQVYLSQIKQQATQRMQIPPAMMDQLNTLVQRLETAVQRLETAAHDSAASPTHGAAGYARTVASNAVGAVAGAAHSALDAVQSALHSNQSAGDDYSSVPVIREYDDAVATGPLQRYLDLSKQLGGDIAQHATMVERAFSLQRDAIGKASKFKKPSDQALAQLIQPLSDELAKVQQFREKNRTSPNFNHLSAISESISALGWITVSPAPAPYIEETGVNATQFYTNRILKDYRGKDERHVEWTKAWVEALKQLQQYVKKQHTTGLTWNNARGTDLPANVRLGGGAAASGGGSSGGGGSAGGPPMPPPPPPTSYYENRSNDDSGASAGSADSRAALFKQINVGAGVTSGLKKVSADQQTHKNPTLRQTGPVPAKSATSASSNVGGKAGAGGARGQFEPSGPPKIELDGKKWRVENHANNRNIIISDTQMSQSVYVYRCTDSVVQIKGKLNSVILDSCRKTAVVIDSLVSALEIVNCQSVQAQITGKLPTVSIEKTDGAQIFLSKESAECEIITAKSSEMNLCIPKDSGEYVEYAVPEQFKTVFDRRKGALKTDANDSLG